MKIKMLKKRKDVFVILFFAMLAGLGLFAYLQSSQNQGKDSGSANVSPDNGQNDNKQKIDTSPGTSADNESTTQKKESDPSTTPATPTSDISVVITRANQDGDGVVRVRGLVFGATSGTCKAVATKNSQVVEKSSAVVLQTNSYTCGQLDFAQGELSQGEWSVYLIISNGPKEVKSGAQQVIIQ